MAQFITIILSIATIWTVAVVTPGPNFFITAQTGATHSRTTSLFVVLGICIGTAVWGVAGYFGFALLFATAPWIYLTIKMLGAGYLIYLGFKLLMTSSRNTQYGKNSIHSMQLMNPSEALRLGLLTTLANPKTGAFVSSLFASTISTETSLYTGVLCIFLMISISLLWYSIVAFLSSTRPFTLLFRCGRKWIERFAGLIFIGFGTKLASS